MEPKPVNGVIVVAYPILRVIVEHSCVVAAASAGAAFEKDIRVCLNNCENERTGTARSGKWS